MQCRVPKDRLSRLDKGVAGIDGDFGDRRLLPAQLLFLVNARRKDPQNQLLR